MGDKDTGGPAFPCASHFAGGSFKSDFPGITMRDYFAAKALESGQASNWRDNEFSPRNGLSIIENTAVAAYEFADAMLKARQS